MLQVIEIGGTASTEVLFFEVYECMQSISPVIDRALAPSANQLSFFLFILGLLCFLLVSSVK